MKNARIRQLILVAGLIAVTCLAMAYTENGPALTTTPMPASPVSATNGIVTLSGALTQEKIYAGGDGAAAIVLTMSADKIATGEATAQHVDMVIVLDRSGSMDGEKLENARKAVLNLVSELSPSDRFALVTYSDDAQVVSGLAAVTPESRGPLCDRVRNIQASGGTNLGRGLEEGIRILKSAPRTGNLGRIVLISDGLANQGITGPDALGAMAAMATEHRFSVTTVGVGYDFNEQLMTLLADRGAGTYYFLENPAAFASVFRNECTRTRAVAASGIRVRIPESGGIRVADAGGYPVMREPGYAVICPGDLGSGETRKLFLNLKVPTGRVATYTISGIGLEYRFREEPHAVTLSTPFTLACVNDPNEALSSINRETWAGKVLTEDFNRLREEVAEDIRNSAPAAAMNRIEAYDAAQQTINAQVKSEAVAASLEHDLKDLRETVADTFSGAPPEVLEKQKANAKAMQYEGYSERRMKK